MAAAFVLGEVCAAIISRAWNKIEVKIETAVGLAVLGMLIGVLVVSLIAVRTGQWKKQKKTMFVELLLLSICFLAGGTRYLQEENKQVEAAVLHTEVEIRARIDWIQDISYGRRVMLSQAEIYGVEQTGFQLCAYISSSEVLYPGDELQALGVIEEFECARNPGEFDSLQYYRFLGCQYTFEVTEITAVRTAKLPIYRLLVRIRERLQSVYQEICTPEASGVYQAMLLGEKAELLPETKELYSANGISHILAISGLHIAVLGMGLYRLCRRISGFGSSGVMAGLLIQLYVMMTGSAVSASRAGIMFVIQLFSHVCRRSYDMLSAAAVALLILLWQNPYYIYNSGCQLSFGAVFAIGAVYPVLVESFAAEKPMTKTLLSSIAVSLVTFPVLAWSFYELSPYSLLLNLLVIPCMTLVMLSGLLGGVAGCFWPMAGRFFVALGQGILLGYEWLCRIIRMLPGSRIVTGRPEMMMLMLYYILLAVGIGLLRWRLRNKKTGQNKWAAACFMLMFPGLLMVRNHHEFMVCFLDVSQGDGIYFETPEGMKVLVDGGSSDEKELYQYTLLPFLKYQGVSRLDFAIVTHPDEDHVSGLKQLLQENDVEIGQLLLPEIAKEMQDEAYQELIMLAQKNGTIVSVLSQGDCLQQGQLMMTCLYPYEGLYTEDRNSYSTVLEICYDDFCMLLTGDIDEAGEQYLLRESLQKGKEYDVLKVAHHGSRYSTTEMFLEKVKPKNAVISCGENNSYGHPHQETLQRLEHIGSNVYITAECGAVVARCGEEMEMCGYSNVR